MSRGFRALVLSIVFQGVLVMGAQLRASVICYGDCPSGSQATCRCEGSGCQCGVNENHCWAVCSSSNCEDTDECEGPIEGN